MSPPVRFSRWLPQRLGLALLPPRCLVCELPGADGRDLCQACRDALPWPGPACPRCALPVPGGGTCGRCLRRPPAWDAAVAALDYRFPLDRLLPRFKFHADLAAGRLLAQWLGDALAGAVVPPLLVPVPLHAARLRQRGYDQALELARPLGRALGRPVRADGLRRLRATASQTTLGAAARRVNVRGAFAAAPGPWPECVALVDDVMTTGATLGDCARALRQAGVVRIEAWVVARAPRPGGGGQPSA